MRAGAPIGVARGWLALDMLIDCDDCHMHTTSACDDCLVTHVLRGDAGDALVLDRAEQRVLRRLSAVGLAPALRHTHADTTPWSGSVPRGRCATEHG